MILKASQRGGARQLALHLLNAKENEHVTVHELRGFLSSDLEGALQEAYAVSRATKARQFLFSLSLNPPKDARVSASEFEEAIAAVEEKLGLEGQPRAIVFHEKDCRLHAHAVWSRIDGEELKAINLPFFKLKLRDVSRELYFKFGWPMPRGLVDSKERDPANFSREEWQQAKRAGHDPKALKEMFQECWAISDSRNAFAAALKARGYTLARGDRRGFVAVDYRGEVYAVAKYVGIHTKTVRSRLGDAAELPSIEQANVETASRMTATLRRHIEQLEAEHKTESASLTFRRSQVVQRQRDARENLHRLHEERQTRESAERARRFRRGVLGLWDRVTGRHGKVRRKNELEAAGSAQRDRGEREQLIRGQLEERRPLHAQIRLLRRTRAQQVEELHRDIATFFATGRAPPPIRKDVEDAHGPVAVQQPEYSRGFGPAM